MMHNGDIIGYNRLCLQRHGAEINIKTSIYVIYYSMFSIYYNVSTCWWKEDLMISNIFH